MENLCDRYPHLATNIFKMLDNKSLVNWTKTSRKVKQFIENETVTTFQIQKPSKLHLPSITLCGTSGFKRTIKDFSDFELEKYFNNTIQLSEIVEKVADHNKTLYRIDHNNHIISDASGKWNIVETYSAYRGRCYTIEYKEMVIC